MAYSPAISKRHKIRSFIFGRREISRQELIALTGCNSRSVSRYAEELHDAGLINIVSTSGRRGRPALLYRSRSETILFAGITVYPGYVALAAVDINGFPLGAERHCFPQGCSGSELLKFIFAHLDGMLGRLNDFSLCAIGVGLTRDWLRQDSGFGAGLLSAAGRRYNVPVEMHDSDSLLLLRFTVKQLLKGAVGGIFCGNEFWLAATENGEIRDGLDPYLRKIRHWQIAPESGEECCCGQRGCLGAVLSIPGVIARWQRLCGARINPLLTQQNFNNVCSSAEEGNPASLRIVRENGRLLGLAAARIGRELKCDRMVLMHTTIQTLNFAIEAYAEAMGENAPPLLHCNTRSADAVFAPAELMQKKLVDFTLDHKLHKEEI